MVGKNANIELRILEDILQDKNEHIKELKLHLQEQRQRIEGLKKHINTLEKQIDLNPSKNIQVVFKR